MGIKVLSYFVGDSYGSDGYMKDFKRMYGSNQVHQSKNVTQIKNNEQSSWRRIKMKWLWNKFWWNTHPM